MAITPKHNKGKLPDSGNKDGDSFQKHDERMRKFRIAHPQVETKEFEDVNASSWLLLIPVPIVNLGKYLQN